jgi:dihydrofolate reductase
MLLQGRRTYQVSAAAWPGRSGDPFSDWINCVPKYVVSSTLTPQDATWQPSTIIRGDDLMETVERLRAQPGGYIHVYGSAMLVRSLLAADLVDELLLTIEPIIQGGRLAGGEFGQADAEIVAAVSHHAASRSAIACWTAAMSTVFLAVSMSCSEPDSPILLSAVLAALSERLEASSPSNRAWVSSG